MTELAIRAATLAVQLDYPVYDCIYLTCALEYGIPYVTVDQELSQAASKEIPNIDVWNIGLSEVAHSSRKKDSYRSINLRHSHDS